MFYYIHCFLNCEYKDTIFFQYCKTVLVNFC
nr:MAG TPA: hypothetical protein [Caudoviricetes sp.]